MEKREEIGVEEKRREGKHRMDGGRHGKRKVRKELVGGERRIEEGTK